MFKAGTKDLKKILEPIQEDLASLERRIIDEISPASSALSSIIQEIFKAGGKRIRPGLSFLFYRALAPNESSVKDLTEKIFLITEISELIHTASLVHDDIIDNSFVRRGRPTANSKWDNAITVISGDFMFARAAVNLGKVGVNEITCVYAKVLEDLCDGEIKQAEKKFSTDIDFDYYYTKTYKKTASLFEAACKAPLIVMNSEPTLIEAAAIYGKNLGLAFQIVDDILDFTSDAKTLGKPAFTDLKDGQITLPVLEALELLQNSNPQEHKVLESKIIKLANNESSDQQEQIVKEVFAYIQELKTIESSFAQAEKLIETAVQAIQILPNSKFKTCLEEIAEFIVAREF